jgi:uncharacterized membrane protein
MPPMMPSVKCSIFLEMNRPWKLILVLTGIFLAGGVTGGFVMLRVVREKIARHPVPEQWAPQHLKRLAERLDLKPEQMEQLRPIVRRNMEELNRLRNYAFTETKSVFERMEREISEKLTPEQRAKFEQMNKEFRERARRFMPEWPGRPPGPGGRRSPRDRPPEEAPPTEKPSMEKPPGGGGG